jgi:hypothetical protein
VAELVRDDDTVALAGGTHLVPFAAGREIIRQRRRRLTLVCTTPDPMRDQLIGMGCVNRLVFAWGNDPAISSLPRIEDAINAAWPKGPEIEEHSRASLANACSTAADVPLLCRRWPASRRDRAGAPDSRAGRDRLRRLADRRPGAKHAGDRALLAARRPDRHGSPGGDRGGLLRQPRDERQGMRDRPAGEDVPDHVTADPLQFPAELAPTRGRARIRELPAAIVTDLGVLIPDPATRELQLASLHPGVTPARVKAATGWNIEVTPDLMQPRAPKPRELSALRIVA